MRLARGIPWGADLSPTGALAVNRAREAYRGGEHKSDRSDALVIADQLRMRWRSLQEICETDIEALSDDLVKVVRETMQPAHVSLWLRPDTASQREQTDQ